MKALDVQNGDATPADLNKTGMLEGALDQIDGGTLDAKHLSEKFLRQPDVIASHAARQSGWKWSVNLDEKRPAGL